ncbi:MAG: isocitrate lyase/phosphoenolpyruvate mutase family protein [Pseudomonadota bacterium]
MSQTDKIRAFRDLHVAGEPLVLMNVWDAGSAKVVSNAGASALATGSFSLVGALGYEDGEHCPKDLVLGALRLICRATDRPVSHDSERGYGETPAEVGEYIRSVVDAGAVGINLEDGVDSESGLRALDEQLVRISAAKEALGEGYLNARTDVFLLESGREMDDLIEEVITRARAFKVAGADGLFVPGLVDLKAINRICEAVEMPVNVMRSLDGPDISAFADAGVARISHGPWPWRKAMSDLKTEVEALP